MKGSENEVMTLNIGGVTFRLNANFHEQDAIRDAELAACKYFNKLRANNKYHDTPDRILLAMTAYQFARWYQDSLKSQNEALRMVNDNNSLLQALFDGEKNIAGLNEGI